MDNKKLGIILLSFGVVILIILAVIRMSIIDAYQFKIDTNTQQYGTCHIGEDTCPHEARSNALTPIYLIAALIFSMMVLGLYLIFFEKSQKEIISTLENQKKIQTSTEKFDILLKGLSEDEQTVIKAVKEQDGITQSTLRLRTDMHKSKLSIVLDSLEKKGLIKRVEKGKTNQVYLKFEI